MRIKRSQLNTILLIAVALIAGAFGYMQDDLFQRFTSMLEPAFYIGGMIGWLAVTMWTALATQFDALRWRWLLSPSLALALILIAWIASILGEVAFFAINGMDTMTWGLIVLSAMLITSAHHFVLIGLPMILTRLVMRITATR